MKSVAKVPEGTVLLGSFVVIGRDGHGLVGGPKSLGKYLENILHIDGLDLGRQ